jgi:hypothetical protein
MKKTAPFIKYQLSGDDGGPALMSASHESKKQARLFFFGGNIA